MKFQIPPISHHPPVDWDSELDDCDVEDLIDLMKMTSLPDYAYRRIIAICDREIRDLRGSRSTLHIGKWKVAKMKAITDANRNTPRST